MAQLSEHNQVALKGTYLALREAGDFIFALGKLDMLQVLERGGPKVH